MSNENSTVYVKMLKDFEVDGRTVRKGKQGSFAYAIANAMIKNDTWFESELPKGKKAARPHFLKVTKDHEIRGVIQNPIVKYQ